MQERNPKHEERLECILTQNELLEKSQKLADVSQSKARLDDERKAYASDFKAKIDSCESQIGVLSQAISTKRETRTVKCQTFYNKPAMGQKEILRLDTDAVIRVESMTDDERQDLFINMLGEQDGIFIFRNRTECPVFDVQPKNKRKESWDVVSEAQRDYHLVQFCPEKGEELRVIKTGDNLYELQRKLNRAEDVDCQNQEKSENE